MNIEEDRRNAIENLPDHFTLSDKDTLDMINRLFEMVRLNADLINMLDKRIKLLEKSKHSFLGQLLVVFALALYQSQAQLELIPGDLLAGLFLLSPGEPSTTIAAGLQSNGPGISDQTAS